MVSNPHQLLGVAENATPEEIDLLRQDLGSDLPLFYGKYCKTVHRMLS